MYRRSGKFYRALVQLLTGRAVNSNKRVWQPSDTKKAGRGAEAIGPACIIEMVVKALLGLERLAYVFGFVHQALTNLYSVLPPLAS